MKLHQPSKRRSTGHSLYSGPLLWPLTMAPYYGKVDYEALRANSQPLGFCAIKFHAKRTKETKDAKEKKKVEDGRTFQNMINTGAETVERSPISLPPRPVYD